MSATLLPVRGLDKTSASFRNALLTGARARDLNPDYLAAVISYESNFRPDAENPYSHALGLIQWVSDDSFAATAKAAGMPSVRRQDLPRMSAEEQLPLVFAWYAGKGLKESSPVSDYYFAVWSPKFIGAKGATVVARKGEKVYDQNPQFDPPRSDGSRKGYFNVADVASPVIELYRAAAGLPRLPADAELVLGVMSPAAFAGALVALGAWWLLPRLAPARRILAL